MKTSKLSAKAPVTNTRVPTLSTMRRHVTGACPPLPPAWPLEMRYPYAAAVSETGITVQFKDFVSVVSADAHEHGAVREFVTDVARRGLTRMLAACLQWNRTEFVPLPSSSLNSEFIQISEWDALYILQRNWQIAQIFAEARHLHEKAMLKTKDKQ